MLKPPMQELMKKINNRYLLVNVAAQRARDIASESEESSIVLRDKPVKLALDEIASGLIEYRENKAEDIQTTSSCNVCAPVEEENNEVSSEEDI